AAEHKTERNADGGGEAEADADALQRGKNVPAYALVIRAIAVEGVGEERDGCLEGHARAWNAAALDGDQLPDADQQQQAEDRRDSELEQGVAALGVLAAAARRSDRRHQLYGLGRWGSGLFDSCFHGQCTHFSLL